MNGQTFKSYLKEHLLLLDGAMGTELSKRGMPTGVCPEQWVLDHPHILIDIQKAYLEAGSQVVYAPTFGANRLKLEDYGLEQCVEQMNRDLVKLSREAVGDKAWIAGDISPTGAQIYPIGDRSFEEIVDVYKEQARALVNAGVDLLVIETMMSLQETRAALIAVKEICDLPVMVAMTYEANGFTLNGTDCVTALITLQNLGADAVGCNCSTGPDKMIPLVTKMKPYAKVPLIVKPNAGLPHIVQGKTVFDMGKLEFTDYIEELVEAGANIIGGCCGSDASFIQCISERMKKWKPKHWKASQGSIITSSRRYVSLEGKQPTLIVGERINPTGKKKLKEQLRQKKLSYIIELAREQIEKGAKILDVNVGMNGIDEKEMMVKVIEQLSMQIHVPLCIDSSNTDVIEAALRVYPGRALVNSISLEKKKIEKLLPIAAKYGAMFILLPLNDKGLPKSMDEKHAMIKAVYEEAVPYGFLKEDIVVDGLVTTVASNPQAAKDTLSTIEWCTESFKIKTIMGLSNISFGLPNRPLINAAFLAMAVSKGLTMAIANPSNELFMTIKMASDVLADRDQDSLSYIKSFNQKENTTPPKKEKHISSNPIYEGIVKGEKEDITQYIREALNSMKAKDIVEDKLIPGITKVGDLFDKGTYFLPQLILSAETMKKGLDFLEPYLKEDGEEQASKPKLIIATVKGDIHDIGKNLVALMFKNHNFDVIDLGKDVESEVIIKTAKKEQADIICLSALMTTTMVEMKRIILLAKEHDIKSKIMVGGAVVTEQYANEIGADGYSDDANQAVQVGKKLLGLL